MALPAILILVFFLVGIAVGIFMVVGLSARRTGKSAEYEPAEYEPAGHMPGARGWRDDEDEDWELGQRQEADPGAEPRTPPWWHARDDY